MTANTLFELYVHELRDLYSAEEQLTEALPKVSKAASHKKLKKALDEHLEETRTHLTRLEQIFESLGEDPSGEHCDAMEGLVEEGEETIEMKGDASVRDAALIAVAQRVEHYEISAYGTAATFAKALGRQDDEAILRETLDEEYEADDLLTEIAVSVVNQDALSADLPIENYQQLSVSEIQDKLSSLDRDAKQKVREFENTHKRRKTLMQALEE